MAKFCENGHPMKPSWDICPYCRRTGIQLPAGRARQVGTGTPPHAAVAAQPRAGMAVPVGADAAGLNQTRIELTPDCLAPRQPEADQTLLRPTLPRQLVGWLVALDGPQRGEDFRLRDGQNIIGSDPVADIRLQGEAVDARHASLRHRDGAFSLTDLDSHDGTFINEGIARIARQMLKDNDVIRIGCVSLKFKVL
jgi:hypothetical protein